MVELKGLYEQLAMLLLLPKIRRGLYGTSMAVLLKNSYTEVDQQGTHMLENNIEFKKTLDSYFSYLDEVVFQILQLVPLHEKELILREIKTCMKSLATELLLKLDCAAVFEPGLEQLKTKSFRLLKRTPGGIILDEISLEVDIKMDRKLVLRLRSHKTKQGEFSLSQRASFFRKNVLETFIYLGVLGITDLQYLNQESRVKYVKNWSKTTQESFCAELEQAMEWVSEFLEF